MQPGQTMYDEEGNQVCLFPLTFLNVTQWYGQGTYSHCCGHPMDLALTSSAGEPCYAPFDCHLVYSDAFSVGNTRIYSSDKPVRTPNGLTYVSVSFTHADNPPSATTYKQGDLIYYSGTAPSVAPHVHIDQSFTNGAQLISSGIYCEHGLCWYIAGSIEPVNVYYMNDTTIYTDYGQPWQTYGGEPGPSPEPEYKTVSVPLFLDGKGTDFMIYKYKKEVKK